MLVLGLQPQRTPDDAALEMAGYAEWEFTAHSSKARPFPDTPHWAVRDPTMKILAKDNFGSLWTEQTQKHFSQVGNIAS